MRKIEENDAVPKTTTVKSIHTKYIHDFSFQDLGYHYIIYFYHSIGSFAPCH